MQTDDSKPVVQRLKGRRKGVHGVCVQIYEPNVRPMYTKSLTIHGMTVDELYSEIIGLVARKRIIKEIYASGKDAKITIEEVNKKNDR